MSTFRFSARCLAVSVLALIFATNVTAQETTGNIEGRLVDDAGKPVAFANVVVSGPALQGSRGVMSTSDGYFGIFKLPVGKYTLAITHVSYQGATFEDVLVQLGKTTTMGEISLETTVHEVPAIVVTGKKKLIDPSTAAIGANLTSEEYKELPIDRDYKDMTTLLPHANESFLGDGVNFAGGTGQGNKYFVDGVEVTDPYLALTGTSLPYNFIEEVTVRTGGYEAQYRSSLGGIVNVISYSGSNEFQGQAFGFFINNQFAGDSRHPVEDPRTGEFAQWDVGLGVGGPIKKDNLWFYAAYNPSFSSEDVEIPDQGIYPDETTTHSFASKLTWRAGSRSNVTLTVMGDPTTRNAVGEIFGGTSPPVGFDNPDPFLVDMKTGGVNVLARGTHMFSDRFFLEGSAGVVTRQIYMQGATDRGRSEPTFIDSTDVWSGGYMTPTDDQSTQITADIRGSLTLGQHMLKTGLEFRDNRLDFNEEMDVIIQGGESLYYRFVFSALDGTVRNRIPSAYIQDDWRMTNRLRFNVGVRWDGQFIYDTNGEVGQKILDQWQPRVGVVYQPGELGTQKIFGSFGRYYADMALALPILKLNDKITAGWIYYDHDPRVDPSGGVEDLVSGEIQEEVDGLEGQHYDEFTLGYERQLGKTLTAGARGIYRVLRAGIEDGYVAYTDSTGDFLYGNPGSGALSDYPEMQREYKGLEFILQAMGGSKYNARLAYVLSETWGNYPGLFDSDTGIIFSNVAAPFDYPDQATNATGLLPNDRTHVLKFSGSYSVGSGFSVGTFFTWMTGTPLSVYDPNSTPLYPKFADTRGTAGRTPDIWDLNFRFVYNLGYALKSSVRPRLIADIFHVGSQRDPVAFNETAVSDPNETPFVPTRYQPPTAMRLGLEVDF